MSTKLKFISKQHRRKTMVRKRAALDYHDAVFWFALLNLAGELTGGAKEYDRQDFPSNFVFGASTSAYQVEGAALEDGRKASTFDTLAHSGLVPGNGDVASDQYHKYKEDVQLMVETGLEAYRFSISWSRILPDGRGHVNPKGLEYYNNLINELILNGIQPHVTLIHLDVPQMLEDEYGGFLSRRIIDDFTRYADVCFREFGDRVLYWTTINEPNMFAIVSYDYGILHPNRCSHALGYQCSTGNTTTYIAAHNALLAHASAAKLYKEKYQTKQRGFLGLNLAVYHFIPFTNTSEDVVAAQRSYDFFVGWFMHPLTYGKYPEIMMANTGSRLPIFTKSETEMVKGSFDFIGVNYYLTKKAKDNCTILTTQPRGFTVDVAALWIDLEGNAPTQGKPLLVTPWGLQGVLEHFKETYNNPPIFIHENGQQLDHNTSTNDTLRVDFLQAHVGGLLEALRNGSDTRGYFVWSFIDVYELLFGTKTTYGLYYVDFDDPNLTRHPKLSQSWYSDFLKGKNNTIEGMRNEGKDISTILRMNTLYVDDVGLL